MRWQSKSSPDPRPGDSYTDKRFALLPQLMGCGTWVWLESYYRTFGYCRDHGWDEDPYRHLEPLNDDLKDGYRRKHTVNDSSVSEELDRMLKESKEQDG